MPGRAILIALAIALCTSLAGGAHAVETLKWEDLAPPWDESQNPIAQLDDQQQADVYTLVWGPNYGDPNGNMDADEQKAHDNLKASGVDPAAILGKIEQLSELADKHDKTLVSDLDGRVVRLPGYVVPLDFDGTSVKSFLLVPYFGACIHTPPPPPNQIVHVQVEDAFQNDELFAPVWVTGRIKAGMDEKSLSFVDGSDDVTVGYALEATKIEPYEEELPSTEE